MVGLLAPSLIALLVVGLRTRSLTGLRQLRIHWWPLALAAMGVELVLHNPPVNQQPWALTLGPAIWVASMAAVLVVVIRNILQRGPAGVAFAVAGLGLGLNLIVVVANGGYMPQSAEARLAARGDALPPDANVTELYNVTLAGPDTRLGWFTDVIAQPRWLPKANVLSIGDVVLSLGMGTLVLITIGSGPHQRRKLADS
jgi:hypothetical protein